MNNGKPWSHRKSQVFSYYMRRCRGNIEIINKLDLVGQKGEMAKLYGIQLHEVITRGSQFKVGYVGSIYRLKHRNFRLKSKFKATDLNNDPESFESQPKNHRL